MFGAASARMKAQLFAELSSMVKAGLSIGHALGIAGKERAAPALGQDVRQMGHEVSGGRPLTEAMEARSRWFSALDVATVEVGENTGRMEAALRNLADFYEREFELRHLLTREMAYPIVLFGAILFIPLIGNVIRVWITESMPAAIVTGFWTLAIYALVLGLPAGLAIFAISRLSASEEGRAQIDGLKLRIPLIGGVFRRIALARYCRALASLYSSGILMGTAMRLAGEAAGNEAVRRDLTAQASEVERGASLTSAFEESRLMPGSVLAMLRTGELTGDVDSMAANVAEHLEAEAQTSIKQLAVSITPVAVILAGIIVAFMVISFYADLYSF